VQEIKQMTFAQTLEGVMAGSSPAPTLTQRRADELRMHVARTAMELFVRDGDTNATVERISASAGIAPRTFYRHFAVKEDVVLPLFQLSSARIAASLRQADSGVALVDALVTAFRSSLDDARLRRRDRAFLGLMMTSPQYRMRWEAVDEDLRVQVTELLGSRLDPSPGDFLLRLAAHLVVHTAREVFELWLTSTEDKPVDALLRRGFTLVLAGLAASEPG
jgi:AcrR family transcriptional regulator